MTTQPPLATRSRLALARQMLVPGLLAAALMTALCWGAGFQRLAQALLQVSLAGLSWAVSAYALTWAFRTWRLWLLANRGATRLAAWTLFRLHISAFAVNALMPARLGDAAQVLYLCWQGVELGRAVAIVIQSRVLDAVSLVLVGLPMSAALLCAGNVPSWLASGLVVCIVAAALPAAVAWLAPRIGLRAFLGKLTSHRSGRLLATVAQVGGDIVTQYRWLASDRRLWALTLAASLAVAFGEGLTAWVVARAVGVELSLLVALLAVSAATVGKSTAATPGGIGLYEGVFAAVLTLFGAPFELALLSGIIDHGLKKAFNVIIGIPAAVSQKPCCEHHPAEHTATRLTPTP